jgi:type VI protein secretion system component VasK
VNILTTVLSWLIFLAFVIGSYFFWEHIASILSSGEYLFVFLLITCSCIWFRRRNKDGFYWLFEDIHQSNLDDIERQELEEQQAEVIK